MPPPHAEGGHLRRPPSIQSRPAPRPPSGNVTLDQLGALVRIQGAADRAICRLGIGQTKQKPPSSIEEVMLVAADRRQAKVALRYIRR